MIHSNNSLNIPHKRVQTSVFSNPMNQSSMTFFSNKTNSPNQCLSEIRHSQNSTSQSSPRSSSRSTGITHNSKKYDFSSSSATPRKTSLHLNEIGKKQQIKVIKQRKDRDLDQSDDNISSLSDSIQSEIASSPPKKIIYHDSLTGSNKSIGEKFNATSNSAKTSDRVWTRYSSSDASANITLSTQSTFHFEKSRKNATSNTSIQDTTLHQKRTLPVLDSLDETNLIIASMLDKLQKKGNLDSTSSNSAHETITKTDITVENIQTNSNNDTSQQLIQPAVDLSEIEEEEYDSDEKGTSLLQQISPIQKVGSDDDQNQLNRSVSNMISLKSSDDQESQNQTENIENNQFFKDQNSQTITIDPAPPILDLSITHPSRIYKDQDSQTQNDNNEQSLDTLSLNIVNEILNKVTNPSDLNESNENDQKDEVTDFPSFNSHVSSQFNNNSDSFFPPRERKWPFGNQSPFEITNLNEVPKPNPTRNLNEIANSVTDFVLKEAVSFAKSVMPYPKPHDDENDQKDFDKNEDFDNNSVLEPKGWKNNDSLVKIIPIQAQIDKRDRETQIETTPKDFEFIKDDTNKEMMSFLEYSNVLYNGSVDPFINNPNKLVPVSADDLLPLDEDILPAPIAAEIRTANGFSYFDEFNKSAVRTLDTITNFSTDQPQKISFNLTTPQRRRRSQSISHQERTGSHRSKGESDQPNDDSPKSHRKRRMSLTPNLSQSRKNINSISPDNHLEHSHRRRMSSINKNEMNNFQKDGKLSDILNTTENNLNSRSRHKRNHKHSNPDNNSSITTPTNASNTDIDQTIIRHRRSRNSKTEITEKNESNDNNSDTNMNIDNSSPDRRTSHHSSKKRRSKDHSPQHKTSDDISVQSIDKNKKRHELAIPKPTPTPTPKSNDSPIYTIRIIDDRGKKSGKKQPIISLIGQTTDQTKDHIEEEEEDQSEVPKKKQFIKKNPKSYVSEQIEEEEEDQYDEPMTPKVITKPKISRQTKEEEEEELEVQPIKQSIKKKQKKLKLIRQSNEEEEEEEEQVEVPQKVIHRRKRKKIPVPKDFDEEYEYDVVDLNSRNGNWSLVNPVDQLLKTFSTARVVDRKWANNCHSSYQSVPHSPLLSPRNTRFSNLYPLTPVFVPNNPPNFPTLSSSQTFSPTNRSKKAISTNSLSKSQGNVQSRSTPSTPISTDSQKKKRKSPSAASISPINQNPRQYPSASPLSQSSSSVRTSKRTTKVDVRYF